MPSGRFDTTVAANPHPEIVDLLGRFETTPAPRLSSLSPASARQIMANRVPDPADPTPVGDLLEFVTDDGTPVRVYVPNAEGPHPALVYFHGGGWVLGDLETHDELCRSLAREASSMVVSVGYRRAPEQPFPAALEDCYAVVEWVFDNAEPMRIDTDNVAVGGDSAGGNLAAAVALRARDNDGPAVARQLLIYPALEPSFDTQSYEENAEGYLLTRADMKWFWAQYLDRGVDARHPYAAPLRARSLDGLPPATVVTCGFDPLRDEGVAYARRLADAGVSVTQLHYADAVHGIARLLVEPVALTHGRELVADVAAELAEGEPTQSGG